MHTTTPPQITPAIRRLVQRVARGGQASYLIPSPEPDAIVHECFLNVAAKIARDGGRMLCGWQLWEWPHVLVEAEFHAVWLSPAGELTEITPKPEGEARILFVPDARRSYQGKVVDNVRLPVREDLLIRQFIRVSELRTEILNRGERAAQYGQVSVPAYEIQPVLEIQAFLGQSLLAGRRDHDPCPCDSGRKFKRCHGREFTPLLGT